MLFLQTCNSSINAKKSLFIAAIIYFTTAIFYNKNHFFLQLQINDTKKQRFYHLFRKGPELKMSF